MEIVIEIILLTICLFVGIVTLSNRNTKRQNDAILAEREANSLLPSEKSKAGRTIGSLITGVPVSTRYGDGSLSPAGNQQYAWTQQALQDIGKKKVLIINGPFGKMKYTRKQLEEHLERI